MEGRKEGVEGGNGPFPIPRVNKCSCAVAAAAIALPQRPAEQTHQSVAWQETFVEYTQYDL